MPLAPPKRLIAIFTGLMLAGPLATARASAEETVLVVLDGSGSMWRAPDGEKRSKLVLVRDGLRAALANTRPTARVGLMAYGHRRSGDCNDVETLVKPEAASADRIFAALEKHNPRGRGPVTQALREAAAQLPSAPSQASVVLIHDDLDNCQLDPCSALEELRARNPGVRVHVVALAMRPEDAQRMTCLTRSTGGRLYEVAGALQIAAAIEDALAPASAAPLAAMRQPSSRTEAGGRPADVATNTETPRVPPALSGPGLHLSARIGEAGLPVSKTVRWRVVQRGSNSASAAWEGDAVSPVLDLATGRYQIDAWVDFVKATTTVDVVKGAMQPLSLVLDGGVLRLPALPAGAPAELSLALADAVMTMTRTDAGAPTVAFQRGLPSELVLATGAYLVGLSFGSQRLERKLEIAAGRATPFDANLAIGGAELTVTAASGGSGQGATQLSLFEDDPDSPQGRREVWRSTANPARVALKAGTYYVVARHGAMEARDRISIRGGEFERRALFLDTARLAIVTKVAGGQIPTPAPLNYRLERLDGDRDITISSRSPAVFDLAAGRYRIEGRVSGGPSSAAREIDLRPGARQELVLEIAAGEAVLRLGGSNGPALEVIWDVRDESGRLMWAGTQPQIRALVPAGRYIVRAETRERRIERTIEVRNGESRTFELTAP
jgi:Ca-activated chloride channel homolog